MSRPAIRRVVVVAATLGLALVGAATASAGSSESANWAGYAIHRAGVRFRTVVGSWTQPSAVCTAGRSSYSSVWVGIGGYSISSPALEQIGTELDCTPTGSVSSGAWYELVPAASRTTRLIVAPGDRMRARVAVAGHHVTLTIANLTRHRSFTKAVRDTVLDTTSAEWIVEAPSACATAADCQTLPLADFGSAVVSGARATTTSGHRGAITDRHWTTTKISLARDARVFTRDASSRPVLAAPSALSAGSTGFTVTYAGTAETATGGTAVTRPTAGSSTSPVRRPA